MTDIRPGTSTQSQFFNQKNESMLDRLLYSDFQRRIGGELTEKQKDRLNKTVKHYMTEVYAKNSGQSLQYLNKEVLTSVVPDYMGYLRRNAGPISEEDSTTDSTGIRTDVSSRFDQIQNERQERRNAPPPPPDFRISLDEAGPTPLSQFEEIKRQREADAARETEIIASRTVMSQEIVVSPRDSPMGRFIDSDTDFRSSADASRQRDQLSVIMREAERVASNNGGRVELPNLPDPQRILLGERTVLPPRQQGIASANPTTAIPDRIGQRPLLPQDVLKSQDDIVSYKETEHNLYVYSADRDWVANTLENRYNFSVSFDPANNQPGFGFNTATNIKFKNIVRIEFVKAIMPTESFDMLPSIQTNTTGSTTTGYTINGYTTSGTISGTAPSQTTSTTVPGTTTTATTTTPTTSSALVNSLNTNILSFPYLQVRIPELNVNGYGTNDGINNAFAVISYDAYWTSDSNANNRGYSRMIPKFLKCQKVYYPTPLATLQKLTFQLQRPDGTLVSTSSDTLTISMILMPTDSASTTLYRGSGSATYEWLWLQTSTWFSQFIVSQGDRLVLKAVNFNSGLLTYPGIPDLINFLTQPQGVLVSAIGRSTGALNGYLDGPNSVGFANSIVIRNSFQDPTRGLTTVSSWVTNYGTTVGTTLYNQMPAGAVISPVVGGTVTVTLGTGLGYAAGMGVFVNNPATPANNFTGVVVSYISSTGVMVINTIANVNGTFAGSVQYYVTAGTIPSAGRLINMNHQVQIIMRVITREMDSASKLRPDNLQA